MKFFNSLLLLGSLTFVLSCCSKSTDDTNQGGEVTPPPVLEFVKGADLSFLPFLESKNTTFYNKEGLATNALDLFKERGMNTVRIRIWHDPSTSASSFEEVKEFSKLVKSKGLFVWLCVHYSDHWADPGQQAKPAAWENLSFEVLKDSVFQYTKKLALEIQPDLIQIGNETNNGFLWPTGKLSENKTQYLELAKQGINAVREFSSSSKIMLHHAGTQGSDWYFSQTSSLDYDFIGLSYYPWWHGNDLDEWEASLKTIKQKFGKDFIIAETAYPFTLNWNDWTTNIVGSEDQLVAAYSASSLGQKEFLLALKDKIKLAGGVGFCYWAPDWVAWDGEESTQGSPWENLALFDFNKKETEALEAFYGE